MNISNNEEIFETHVKRICMPICDRVISTDISNDFTLPDYSPEIRRILNVSSSVIPPAKYINTSCAEYNGNIDYNILYVGSDGELYSIPLNAEYNFNVPIDADGFDFNEGVTSCVDMTIDNLTTRLSGPRRLNIKCKMRAHSRIYGIYMLDEKINGKVNGNSIETLEERCENVNIVRANGELLQLSEEIIPENPNIRVVGADGKVLISSVSPSKDVAKVDGHVYLKLLCADNDVGGIYNNIYKRIPFSHSVELDGISANCCCYAIGYINDLSISMEEERIICDLSLLIEVEGQTPNTFEYVKDMYSTENESTCLFRDYTVPSSGYCVNGNFSMNERIAKENLSIPEGASIVDVYGSASVDSTERSGEKMNVLGSVKYTLILSANDEYSSMDIILPTKFEFDCDSDNIALCESKMVVLSCKARADSDYIGIDAEIGVSSMGQSNNDIMVLDEISFSNRIEKRRGEITVCYTNSADSIWSIAKKHHISVAHIESVNELSGGFYDRDYLII